MSTAGGYPQTGWRSASRPFREGPAFEAPSNYPVPAVIEPAKLPAVIDKPKKPALNRARSEKYDLRNAGRGLRVGRALGKFVRWANTAYDVYKYLQDGPQPMLWMPGFTKVHECPVTMISPLPVCGRKATPSSICYVGQANPCAIGLSDAYTSTEIADGTGFWKQTGPFSNGSNQDRWVADGSIRNIPRWRDPFLDKPAPALGPTPALAPEALPILRPQPVVRPLPYRLLTRRVPDARVSPNYRNEWGPSSAGAVPQTQPGGVMLGPRLRKKITAWPPSPPRRGERERKVRTNLPAGLVNSALNAVTEGADLIDAVYQALPEKLRKREQAKRHGKDPKIGDKLWLLWNNYDKVDIEQAAFNVVKEGIEDAVFGRLGQAAGRGRRSPYGDYGGTRGPAL